MKGSGSRGASGRRGGSEQEQAALCLLAREIGTAERPSQEDQVRSRWGRCLPASVSLSLSPLPALAGAQAPRLLGQAPPQSCAPHSRLSFQAVACRMEVIFLSLPSIPFEHFLFF